MLEFSNFFYLERVSFTASQKIKILLFARDRRSSYRPNVDTRFLFYICESNNECGKYENTRQNYNSILLILRTEFFRNSSIGKNTTELLNCRNSNTFGTGPFQVIQGVSIKAQQFLEKILKIQALIFCHIYIYLQKSLLSTLHYGFYPT